MKICRTEKQSEYMYIQFQVPTLSMIIKYFLHVRTKQLTGQTTFGNRWVTWICNAEGTRWSTHSFHEPTTQKFRQSTVPQLSAWVLNKPYIVLGQNFVETKCMVKFSILSLISSFPYIGRLQECVTLSHKYISFIFLMAEIRFCNTPPFDRILETNKFFLIP